MHKIIHRDRNRYCWGSPITFIFIIFFVWGCESQLHKDQSKVLEMIKEAQMLKKQQALLQWFYITEGKVVEMAQTYENYQDILSLAQIQFVTSVLTRTTNKERISQMRYFKNFLMEEYVAMKIAPASDHIDHIQRTYSVPPFRNFHDLRQVLWYERENREQILQALKPAFQAIDTLRQEIRQLREQSARELGYPSYIGLASAVRDFSENRLYEIATELLSQTDSLYLPLLRQFTAEPPATNADSLQKDPFAGAFMFEQLLPAARFFLKGLGIQLNRQSHLTIDINKDPGKQSGAYCKIIDVPRDVRLSVTSENTYLHHETFFHELGHAELALFNQSKSPVFQVLYDSPVMEVFAVLFQKVWEDSAFTAEVLKLPAEETALFRRFLAFHQLQALRLSAAVVQYEIDLIRQDIKPAPKFADYLENALATPLTEDQSQWLEIQTDDFGEAADFLLASLIEASLRNYLDDKFNRPWYKNLYCGKYLKSLWSRGNHWSIPEFMKTIEMPELNAEPLLRQINSLYGLQQNTPE